MKQNKPTICAIITARGGSKGILHKNIVPLNGKPLLAYSIEAASQSAYIQDVYVTTDDPEIAVVSKEYGAMVIDRPDALSTDTAGSYETVKHALEVLAEEGKIYDHFILLQPTSPLRTSQHVDEALKAYLISSSKSCMSVCEAEHPPYKMLKIENDILEPLFDESLLAAPRQSLPKIYRQNGAIYIMGCDDFLHKVDNFFYAPVLPYVMASKDSVDIDNMNDLAHAESLMRNRQV